MCIDRLIDILNRYVQCAHIDFTSNLRLSNDGISVERDSCKVHFHFFWMHLKNDSIFTSTTCFDFVCHSTEFSFHFVQFEFQWHCLWHICVNNEVINWKLMQRNENHIDNSTFKMKLIAASYLAIQFNAIVYRIQTPKYHSPLFKCFEKSILERMNCRKEWKKEIEENKHS